jgi:hypothetical protein
VDKEGSGSDAVLGYFNTKWREKLISLLAQQSPASSGFAISGIQNVHISVAVFHFIDPPFFARYTSRSRKENESKIEEFRKANEDIHSLISMELFTKRICQKWIALLSVYSVQ